MDKIREFLGAEYDNVDVLREGKVFSLNYENLDLEFYTYNPPIPQKAADLLHIAPTPDYIVEVKNGFETSYFEATRRGAKEILQRPKSEFSK